MLSDNYRWPQGKRFGLDTSQGWSMTVPLHIVDGESMNDAAMADQKELEEMPVGATGELSNREIIKAETDDTIINGDINILDLNVEVDPKETREDVMEVMSTRQISLV